MKFHKLFVLKFLLLLQRSICQNCDSPGGSVPCDLRCQFYDTGEFYNNADKCKDDIPDCQMLFNCPAEATTCEDPWEWYLNNNFMEGNPESYPKVRSTVCDLPGIQHIARKCAKTCNLCCEKPEFMCYNDPDWTDWCVEHQYEYCHSEEWRPVMAELCGQTCGLCLERVCADKIYDCESASELCTHIDHIEFMRENCAGACGYCPVKTENETCVDLASNCQQLSHLCKDRIYTVGL